MTKWNEIEGNKNYIKILDHGFVGIVDTMGSDSAIVQAARVSYGSGTKTLREDRGLIRYLYSHQHMSPFEMCDIKFHLKIPVIVMRQLVRHRTSSLNEISARYSRMEEEFYIPSLDQIQPQSKQNHQGRFGSFNEDKAKALREILIDADEHSFNAYNKLLGTDEDPGLARELARTVLPVGHYTELYWKQNLRNLFHLLKLREDSHAQWEIQELAKAMHKLVNPIFPEACKAFEDYHQNAKQLSAMEQNLLADIFLDKNINIAEFIEQKAAETGLSDKDFAEKYNMSKRELKDFIGKFS